MICYYEIIIIVELLNITVSSHLLVLLLFLLLYLCVLCVVRTVNTLFTNLMHTISSGGHSVSVQK